MGSDRGIEEERRAAARARRNQPVDALPAPFVVGVARSGTTLLRLMLDAHPDLAIPPETHFIHRLAKACGTTGKRAARGAPTPACVLETLTTYPRWPDFGLDRDELARRFAELDEFSLGGALRCFYELYAARCGKPRWGDKTPEYVIRMSLIQRLLPEARFVHLIRDGRDVWLSLRGVPFGPGSVDAAAAMWRDRISTARSQAAGLPFYLEVRYEDLVLEPEATLRRTCAFLELPWDAGMLTYHDRAEERLAEIQDVVDPTTGRLIRAAVRRSHHGLVGAPPQRDRVGRWRTELDQAERERFAAVAGPMLRELGYDLD